MINCDKYRSKAIIGAFLWILFFLTSPFTGNDLVSGALIIALHGIKLSLLAIALILMLPYVKCISENRRKMQPPFS